MSFVSPLMYDDDAQDYKNEPTPPFCCCHFICLTPYIYVSYLEIFNFTL